MASQYVQILENGSSGGGGGGSGTVTSVGLAAPAEFTVTGSPVTTSGTLGFSKANQNANLVYSGPTSGGAAAPTFRSLVTADLPAGIGTVTSVAMTVPSFLSVAGSPITTTGTLAVSLSGTALPIANGGTAGTTANGAFNNLSPSTTKGDLIAFSTINARLPVGSDNQVLTADSGQTLGVKWATPTTGTVTSVGLSSPGVVYTVSGSPVTSSGTLALNLISQSANTILAGPTSGGSVAPTFRALVSADLPSNPKIRSFGITIDGAGSTITTGVKGYFMVPYACTITGWTLLADQVGSIVVDVWEVAYASFPPTISNTITGADIPTISAAQKGQNLTLSAWTTAVTAGNTFGYNVNSCTTITRATLIIQATVT